MVNYEDLLKFNDELMGLSKQNLIRGPFHLHGGAEENLIKIFQQYYTEDDFIVSNHRNHYHWLLSGRSKEKLIDFIKAGDSMHIADENFITSAIVGGGPSIAIGIAWGIKLQHINKKVLCFIGDMAALTGIAMESIRYACGHELPILFIIEDNSLCVNAITRTTCGCQECNKCNIFKENLPNVIYFKYRRIFGHAGIKYSMF